MDTIFEIGGGNKKKLKYYLNYISKFTNLKGCSMV
jgi:hypothetical protein